MKTIQQKVASWCLFSLMTFVGGLASESVLALGSQPQIPTVAEVDLDRYDGLWYEIARIPNNFQDNKPKGRGICERTTAEYTVLGEKKIGVTNTCYRLDASGVEYKEVAEAIARPVEGSNNSKLKVNFTGIALLRWLGIGNGDYWIMDLGPLSNDGSYSWVLVGSPKLNFGWILSRTPELDAAVINQIFEKAESIGYSRKQFRLSAQAE